MKQRTFNTLCLVVAVFSGIGMFLLKYHVVDQEKQLELLRQQIIRDKRELHLLRADWAVLTDPQHMRELIKKTNLKPMQAKQIISPENLEDKPVLPRKENASLLEGGKDV